MLPGPWGRGMGSQAKHLGTQVPPSTPGVTQTDMVASGRGPWVRRRLRFQGHFEGGTGRSVWQVRWRDRD